MISSGQQVIPRPLKAVKMLSCLVLRCYLVLCDKKPCTIQVDASNVGVGSCVDSGGESH